MNHHGNQTSVLVGNHGHISNHSHRVLSWRESKNDGQNQSEIDVESDNRVPSLDLDFSPRSQSSLLCEGQGASNKTSQQTSDRSQKTSTRSHVESEPRPPLTPSAPTTLTSARDLDISELTVPAEASDSEAGSRAAKSTPCNQRPVSRNQSSISNVTRSSKSSVHLSSGHPSSGHPSSGHLLLPPTAFMCRRDGTPLICDQLSGAGDTSYDSIVGSVLNSLTAPRQPSTLRGGGEEGRMERGKGAPSFGDAAEEVVYIRNRLQQFQTSRKKLK